MPPYDDENVTVNQDHEKQRREKETGVLATETKFSNEVRFTSVRLFFLFQNKNVELFFFKKLFKSIKFFEQTITEDCQKWMALGFSIGLTSNLLEILDFQWMKSKQRALHSERSIR